MHSGAHLATSQGHTHGEDLGHHHPAGSHLMLGQGGLSVSRTPTGEDNISPRVGMRTRQREDEEENKHLNHLRYKVMASRLRGEAEPVPVRCLPSADPASL